MVKASPVSHVPYPNTPNGQSGLTLQTGSVSFLAPDTLPALEELIAKKGILAKLKGLAPKVIKEGLKIIAKVGVVGAVALSVAALGIGFTAAVCTYTNLCSFKFNTFEYDNDHLQEAVRAYMNPDKLSSLTDFVMNSIQKYTKNKKKSRNDD